uniref:Non-structural protein V n=1 Tax=Rinderpest virus (strain RBOK) TaxID=36409 RepID=V_RINDR|nr:RecName: Full=Non-structural protein V [Rinderpest virus (strain RBOK)]UKI59121.1 V protein [Rinderpest morbillivirus]CAA48390.2 V protein [Rinderpest morbillivirus]
MAEEQAYHVNKGLECIKALRARPLDPLVVEEALAAWVETSEGQTLDRMSSDEAEADHQDISKPCFPAAGPGKSSMSRCHDQGLRGSNSCDEELGAFIGDSSMHSTEVQHYHVYDHSGEKVEGVEDADSILVQSGADDGVEVWGGDEESENSDVDSGEPDPEGSAPADWGSSPISPATRASDVETVEGDEIQKLLEDQSRIRKMTKAGKTLVVPPIPSQERPTASEKPIKKGHRREIDLIWNDGRVFIDRWCNPTCSKVTVGTVRAKCICGECPRVCEQCITDSGIENRIWYHNLADIPE